MRQSIGAIEAPSLPWRNAQALHSTARLMRFSPSRCHALVLCKFLIFRSLLLPLADPCSLRRRKRQVLGLLRLRVITPSCAMPTNGVGTGKPRACERTRPQSHCIIARPIEGSYATAMRSAIFVTRIEFITRSHFQRKCFEFSSEYSCKRYLPKTILPYA
jgi:hypothetical protein